MHVELTPLPAFEDNYVWCLSRGDAAVVVDPGDASVVQQALAARGWRLAGILVTHHHGDHVGGLGALAPLRQGPLYLPATETIAADGQRVRGGDAAELLGLRFEVIDVPGHTAGHIAYFWPGDDTQAPLLLCGDTLFSAGCGRLFEGTAAQMHAALTRLAALPAATRVCCAHEYTLANLRFAQAVEPDNADIAAHLAHCIALREAGQPTLPSSIGLERRINPFLRCAEPAVVRAACAQDASLTPAATGTEVLAVLREWKNRFR
jgi:hydroxyacylglutathione hydrolase